MNLNGVANSTKMGLYLYVDNPSIINNDFIHYLKKLSKSYTNLYITITKNTSIGKSNISHISDNVLPTLKPKKQRKLIITTEILLTPNEDISKAIAEFKDDVEYNIYGEYEDTPKITNITEINE